MNSWNRTLTIPPPFRKWVAVSDGVNWCRGMMTRDGRWEMELSIEPVYWMQPESPPLVTLQAADGATIIGLSGLLWDIHATVMAGDELWTTTITDLATNKQPVLTFVSLEYDGVFLHNGAMIKERNEKLPPVYADWNYIRQTAYRVGANSCYLRRVSKSGKK